MIKTEIYCDHCGKEIKRFNRVNIIIETCPDTEWMRSTTYNKDFQLCNNCYNGLYKYIEIYMEGCKHG
jgi:hypothetical protein